MTASAAGVGLRARAAGIADAPPWPLALWVATALYVVLLSLESIYEHYTYRTNVDVSVYDQRLWLLAQGIDPFSTVVSKPFLGDHFEPALVLLTPIYWLGLGVPGLLVVQTIGLALAAPALYLLARSLGAAPGLAALPALLWLAAPAVAAVNLFEFHPPAFVPALLVLSVYAALHDRFLLLAVTTLLALGLKEDVPLTYFILGLLLVAYGKRRTGSQLAVVSVVWFGVGSLVVGGLSDQYEWQGRRFAGERGDSLIDALEHMLRNPLDTVVDALANAGLESTMLLLSTGGLALLAPVWMLLGAPTIAYNALSAYELQHDLAHHYHLLAVTGMFVAAAVGAGRVGELRARGRRAVVVGTALALTLAIAGGVFTHDVSPHLDAADRAAIRLGLERIPDDAAVAAAPGFLPHLSHRIELYSFPEPFVQLDWGSPLTEADMAERAQRLDYVVLSGSTRPIEFEGDPRDVRRDLLASGWRVTFDQGPIEILERE